MPCTLLLLFFLICSLGVLTFAELKNKPVKEIQDLLDYLAAQKSSKNEGNQAQQVSFSTGHQHKKRSLHDTDAYKRNTLNIQTLNLFNQQNQLRNKKQEEEEIENLLRSESDRICKATGRCGCGGGRCGKPSIDRNVDEIDQLLKDIDKDLNEENNENFQIYEANIKANNDEQDLTLKRSESKFSTDDNLDIIFLELPDSDDRLIVNESQDLNDDIKIIDLRNIDLNDLIGNPKLYSEINKGKRPYVKAVSPEDFVAFYEEGKNKLSNNLLGYIKDRQDETVKELNLLVPKQRKQLKNLKTKHSRRPLSDKVLKEEIVKTLFGNLSSNKIFPQTKDENIYIPQRMHDAVLQFIDHRTLRRTKRLFPLTTQQKGRMYNKNGPKIIANHSWRKNMEPQPSYGVPFDLDVQGLAQVN